MIRRLLTELAAILLIAAGTFTVMYVLALLGAAITLWITHIR